MEIKTELAKRIIQAIHADERTSEVAVEAIDNNGVVTLKGIAPSEEARSAVVEIVQAFDGVHGVISDIALRESDAEKTVIVPPLVTHSTDRVA